MSERFLTKLSRSLQSSPAGRVVKGIAHRVFPSLYYRLYEKAGAYNPPAIPPSVDVPAEARNDDWTKQLTSTEADDLFVVRSFDATPELIAANIARNAAFLESSDPVKTIHWFLPHPEHLFAGVRTILAFAARLQTAHGIQNNIVVYNYPHVSPEKIRNIQNAFPALKDNIIVYSGTGDLAKEIGPADVAIATLWTSVYFLLPLKNIRATYYFIQDYEPLFYPGGTTSGVCEATYRMGLQRLCNTPGLLEHVKSVHGGDGVAFVPSVNREVYHPPAPPQSDPRFASDRTSPVRIFFYGRPKEARNGFLLGLEALRRVKAKYGDKVEIVTAGGQWDEADYGVKNVLKNLGRLASLDDVANLYRSCDIGLVFMFTKHPSYQPFEFMACGACVVTNINDATTWLLKDGENALITETTVAATTDTLGRLIDNPTLRRHLAEGGYCSVPTDDWDTVIDRACREAGLLPKA